MAKGQDGNILQIKITLRHLRPPVWRRVQAPDDLTLRRLHDVIQATIGWLDYHLHEFEVEGRRYGQPEIDGGDISGYTLYSDRNIRLRDLSRRGVERFAYEYDFGDGWEHELRIEKALAPEPGIEYPVRVGGRRRGPPEDCGGPLGFAHFLEAINDESHPDHEELFDWYGEPFDAEDIEPEKIEAMLGRIRAQRRKGPRRARQTS